MGPNFDHPRIVFHHIPKCGGTSVVWGIALTYYPIRLLLKGKAGFSGGLNMRAVQSVHNQPSSDQYDFRRKILVYQLARGDSPLVYGHYPFSQAAHDRFGDQWSFVTILRDPVRRWYSHYLYNRFKTEGVGKTTLGFEGYLESDEGRANARSFVNFMIEAEDPCRKATQAEAKLALQAIEQFDVCGCLEDLSGFRVAMKQRFGRKPFVPRLNSGPAVSKAQPLPDRQSVVHKRLLYLLEADCEVYRSVFDHPTAP